MADQDDRLSALIDNAELLIHYNTQTQVMPSSKLETALQQIREDNTTDFYSEAARNLRAEVSRMVKLIKPATVAELRTFFPYTTNVNPRQTWGRWILDRLFTWSFIACAVYLFVLCASYTMWSNRASVFLNEVQAEANRLAADGLNNIMKRWETVPVVSETLSDQELDVLLKNADDYRVMYGYQQKFLDLTARQEQLLTSAPMPWNPMPFSGSAQEQAVFQASLPRWLAAVLGTGATNAELEQIEEVSADQTTGTDGQFDVSAEGTGGGNVENSYGLDESNSGTACLDNLQGEIGDYYTDLIQHWKGINAQKAIGLTPTGTTVSRTAANTSKFDLSGGDSMIDATSPGGEKEQKLVNRGLIALNAVQLSARGRDINMKAFGCLYSVTPGDSAWVQSIGQQYLTTLRTIRNKLDARNSWALPGLYGALGAVLLTLRIMVNPSLPNPPPSRTLIRVVLGGFVGVIIGWFWSPQSSEFFDVANISVGLFTIAFLFGYGIDIFFTILERVILSISDLFDRSTTA